MCELTEKEKKIAKDLDKLFAEELDWYSHSSEESQMDVKRVRKAAKEYLIEQHGYRSKHFCTEYGNPALSEQGKSLAFDRWLNELGGGSPVWSEKAAIGLLSSNYNYDDAGVKQCDWYPAEDDKVVAEFIKEECGIRHYAITEGTIDKLAYRPEDDTTMVSVSANNDSDAGGTKFTVCCENTGAFVRVQTPNRRASEALEYVGVDKVI